MGADYGCRGVDCAVGVVDGRDQHWACCVSNFLLLLFPFWLNALLIIQSPHIGSFVTAGAAAVKILNTIKRESPIDVESTTGQTLDQCDGNVEFQNVKLIYPSRPNATVLQDFSLVIPPGKMTAIVGPSGSGKSSLVGLIERFYLPIQGKVLLDGHDISQLNLRWLRSQLALVGQEPTLFADTVYRNIELGLVGTAHEHVSSRSYCGTTVHNLTIITGKPRKEGRDDRTGSSHRQRP